jgi:hypothetical protein
MLGLLGLAAGALALSWAPGASGVVPGENGPVAFTRGVNDGVEIYLRTPAGEERRLTTNETPDVHPAISPNGSSIAFSREGGVWTMATDGSGGATRLGTGSEPAWAPDGARIAFSRDGGVWTMDADGSDSTRLGDGGDPAWSPDGDRIVFVASGAPSGLPAIWLMGSAGQAPRQVSLAAAGSDFQPAWSPDGGRIAFTSTRNGGGELFVIAADATETPPDREGNPGFSATPLVSIGEGGGLHPAWSPEGQRIAFQASRLQGGAFNTDLYAVAAAGGAQERLTSDPAPDQAPDWGVPGEQADELAPSISIASPADGATYLLGQAVSAEYSCQDEAGGSGLAACAGPVASGAALSTATPGPASLTVGAADHAGNSSSLTHSYAVLYPFAGFFAPVDNLPVLNEVRAGQAIPLKFSLGGDRGLGVIAPGYPRSQQVACDSAAPVDGIEETASAGASGLTYDPMSDRYHYVWKTEGSWAGTCRQLVIKLIDSSNHRASFKLR